MKLFQHAVLILIFGLLSANALSAQTKPKKIIFVSSVGSAPPPATTSSIFRIPLSIAIGASVSPGSITGAIYVADPENNQVLAFAQEGGSPVSFSALPCPSSVSGCVVNPWPLRLPGFVAAAPNGNLWISDTGNDVVVEINPAGTVMAFAGAGPSNVVNGCSFGIGCPSHPNSGQGNGQFFGPGPLAVDKLGNVYVADAAGGLELEGGIPSATNIRIQKFASNGAFVTTWGSWCTLKADGTQAAGNCNASAPGAVALGDGQFAKVNGVAIDDASNVYVSEDGNNRVQKFNTNGAFLLKWGGLPTGNSDGQFAGPGGVAVDLDQSIYVVDIANNRIQEFDGSGHFIGKGGSKGSAEAQFAIPYGIATVPPAIALLCLFAPDSDCVHGFVVSEVGADNNGSGGNTRVQFLAGRQDTDNDGITDELDATPGVFSNNFSNALLGFTTFGSIVNKGDQTFTLYNTLSPNPANQVRIRTESFGGPTQLTLSLCGQTTLSFAAGDGANMNCSTPTVVAEYGPVGFRFAGADGTIASGSIDTGASVSFNQQTSSVTDNSGNVPVTIGGNSISLTQGQTAFADSTPPTTMAALSPSPNANQWNNTTVVASLSAADNPGGSGVNTITYSLTGAQTGSAVVLGASAAVPVYAEGVTTVSFFATDSADNHESTKSVTVRIDRTSPKLLCSASPSILRPTNRLVAVNLSVTVDYGLSGSGGFVLSSVTSNERQPDKDVARDIQGFAVGTPSTRGFLRAEKAHRDRMYTFVYTGTDLAGNQGSCTVTVSVPRHRERDGDDKLSEWLRHLFS